MNALRFVNLHFIINITLIEESIMTTKIQAEALRTIGNQRKIAEAFDVTPMAVSLWLSDKFPPSRVLELYHLCDKRYDIEELLAK